MGKMLNRLLKVSKEYLEVERHLFLQRHGRDILYLLEVPAKILTSPVNLVFDIVSSAQRGFDIPKRISDLSFSAIFVVGTLGISDITFDLGRKVLSKRNCKTCNGWQAFRCTMCKGTGKVRFQVKNYRLRRGEAATAECVADAIIDRRAKLLHLSTAIDPPFPLPSKECTGCDGTGVMGCPECKDCRLQLRISADDITGSPWEKAFKVLKRMDFPYENIVDSMRDPKIAAFWLLTMPQMIGGFEYDDIVKQKIWWTYKESMKYDQIRELVARRKPGWEQFQKVLVSLDPVRAKNDPVIVKNISYHKAKKALEAEVMKLNVPPRPDNWGVQELNLPLKTTSWSEEELKDPKILLEMTTLLNAQREMADKILNVQWETKWRQEKLNELLAEKIRPYLQKGDRGVLPKVIATPLQQRRQKRWFFF